MTDDRRAFGSITRRADGRWRVRYREAGKRLTLPGAFDTYDEAAAVLEALRRKLEGTARAHTPRGLAEDWLDWRERSGVRGVAKERALWARIVTTGADWIDTPVRQVRTGDLQRWVDARLVAPALTTRSTREGVTTHATDRKVSRKTVANELGLVRLFFTWVVRHERATSNPATDVQIDKRRDASTDDVWTYLEPAEITLLTTDPRIPAKFRTLYTVAIYLGLRKGEILGLRWEDVTLGGDDPRVTVRRSYDGPTKAGKVADVPLLDPARRALEAWRSRGGVVRARGLVFPNREGGMHTADFDCGWIRWPAAVGITRKVRFHDLRHTCASALVSGVWGPPLPLEAVRDWLRHSSVAMTQRYAHLRPEALRSYRSALDEHLTREQ